MQKLENPSHGRQCYNHSHPDPDREGGGQLAKSGHHLELSGQQVVAQPVIGHGVSHQIVVEIHSHHGVERVLESHVSLSQLQSLEKNDKKKYESHDR